MLYIHSPLKASVSPAIEHIFNALEMSDTHDTVDMSVLYIDICTLIMYILPAIVLSMHLVGNVKIHDTADKSVLFVCYAQYSCIHKVFLLYR